jgi:uncharacterized membrane protein
MKTIDATVTVKQPLSVVYNQWTQFEEFPLFMQGVKQVRQTTDKTLHWVAEIAGCYEEWDAEIFEQIPDQRIAWRSTCGAKNSGVVNFEAVDGNQTKIDLHLSYDPEGAAENVGDALGFVSLRVHGDLNRFKEFIESRQTPSGAWRGHIRGREVNPI